MSMSCRGALLSLVRIDPDSSVPKFRQLGTQLREAVLSGRLIANTRLPSTRELATDLGVSRLTVQNTYEQLISEGYLEARVGSGTWVAELRARDLSPDREDTDTPSSTAHTLARLSERGQKLQLSPQIVHHTEPRPFHAGTPALDEFPVQIWTRLSGKHWRRARQQSLNYGDPAGYRPLREAIATYLGDARGVNCDADQVLVVSGAQQAFCLSTWALLDNGDPAWIEDPGHIAGREALLGSGARVVPVPVDEHGLDVRAGLALEPDPKLIMVTPSHQHPLGTTMSLPRRLELLETAYSTGAWIIEDDYDSEFRFKDRPLTAMQGIDEHNHVIYVGTFSKVLFPSLRLAYLVVPRPLIDTFTALYALLDRAAPTMPQAVLADFIGDGYFTAHIRKMRNLYAERQQALLEALTSECAGLIRPAPTDSGMHLMGWLPEHLDDRQVAAMAHASGVDVLPLSMYCVDAVYPPGLLLGFSCVRPETMRPAARKLAQVLERALHNQKNGLAKMREVAVKGSPITR